MSGQLEDLLREAPFAQNGYRICAEVNGAFLARSGQGRAALLMPTTRAATSLGRAFGALLLKFRNDVAFDVGERRWSAPAAVLECLDEALIPTFVVLAEDLSRNLDRASDRNPESILTALAPWERLLRNRGLLSEERQIGLWGELLFILEGPSIDGAVRAWSPSSHDVIDFVNGGVGIEVKTSTIRLKHTVSLNQARASDGVLRVAFASIWAVPDASGKTLIDLVESISAATSEGVMFEQKVLLAGFSRLQGDAYGRKFSSGAPLSLFPGEKVPRVRAFDPGVVSIRYSVELDPAMAMSRDEASGFLSTVCSQACPSQVSVEK